MPNALELWIYRDGREAQRGPWLLAELLGLLAILENARGERARRTSVEALLACGEIEAALEDAADPAARAIAAVTDALAAAALGLPCDARAVSSALCEVAMPAHVTTTAPEGFSYYALHPEAYARAVCARPPRGCAPLVVGVRSIGTTLSAIACAAMIARGEPAVRITVRPFGDPGARKVVPEEEHRRAIHAARDRDADVLVVDEGPGVSGSTFLAAAEAIAAEGVAAERITLVCSHAPALDTLSARNAAARFERFRMMVVPPDVRVPSAEVDVSAGAWRSRVYPSTREDQWPASFTQTERRKVLMPNGRLAKFEGMGRVGRNAAVRALTLASAGLSPSPRDEGDGWLSYAWHGTPLRRDDLDGAVIDRMAAYCAMRPTLCPANACTTLPSSRTDLEAMVTKNLAICAGHARSPSLQIERLAVVDGRMAPHEWLRGADGLILKSDGVTHGDDHFFPGPTDVAWDLAGAIVEWGLDEQATDRLLAGYAHASRDDARPRMPAWTLAYAAFRLAFTTVGMVAARGTPEAGRLARAAEHYRSYVVR